MCKKFGKCLLWLTVFACITGMTVQASPTVPYETYTYLSDYTPAVTSHAYVPERALDGEALEVGALTTPLDICTDSNGRIYIADTGNNRILCFDSSYSLQWQIASFDRKGQSDALAAPEGVYAAADGKVYVADTGNGRIIVFDENGSFLQEVGRPDTALVMGGGQEDITYQPSKVSADPYGRIFAVAKSVGMGILEFTSEGEFSGFVGAQKVTFNIVDYMWKTIMTDMQLDRTSLYVPTEYSNIICDEQGFLYAVISTLDADAVAAMLDAQTVDNDLSPVKKFSAGGYDVLRRNGYHPPSGDLYHETDLIGNTVVSVITDVALGPAGTYTLLDSQRSRLFTYSRDGDLLFAFGDQGAQVGNNESPASVAYLGDHILTLDSRLGRITEYSRTEYGDKIISALEAYNSYQFDRSAKLWREILEINPNFDLAYDGLAQVYAENGEYQKAMEYFRYSNNREQYSLAFQEYRTAIVKEYLPLFILGLTAVIVIVVVLIKAVQRCNRRAAEGHPGKFASFTYAFHIMTHPIEGFWDLKHEKRGKLSTSLWMILLVFLAMLGKRIMTAWLMNEQYDVQVDILQQLFSVVGLIAVFVVSNWCLTTLMDGEGNMKDIIIATGYAVFPMFCINVLLIPISYILTVNEMMYLSFFGNLALLWSLLLIFCGVMVTHQYTLSKSIATCLLSVVGMAIIVFILLLLLTTVTKMTEFVDHLIVEIIW